MFQKVLSGVGVRHQIRISVAKPNCTPQIRIRLVEIRIFIDDIEDTDPIPAAIGALASSPESSVSM
jgi:hypothetical protein